MLTITSEAYHADPAVEPSLSASIAKVLLGQSPLHAWIRHPRLNPDYAPEESVRFDIGSAAHAVLLERDESKIVVVDAADWRSKAAKEARDNARADGKLPVLASNHSSVKEMAEIAREYLETTELAGLLSNGMPEQTILWQDSGAYCRSRLDWLKDDYTVILDYKTTDSADPETFIRQIPRMGYDIQAEMYCQAVKAETGVDPVFVFLAQEIEMPYACSLVALSNTYRDIAFRKFKKATSLWAKCLSDNYWPSYSTSIHYAEPSAWALSDFLAQESQNGVSI